ncbi:unnamed protein product, partial [Bubo scandiacus]
MGQMRLNVLEKGGALPRRSGFSHGVWCAADGRRVLPLSHVPPASAARGYYRLFAGERRQPAPGGSSRPGRGARSAATGGARFPRSAGRAPQAAGGEDRLGSARL